MVYETTDQMSAVKKLSLRRGIKFPFGRKSSKKTAELSPTMETKNLFVDDASDSHDSAVMAVVVASPSPEGDDANQPGMDIKSESIISKGPSSKSYKWPFRNRRSEDNGNLKTEPKMSQFDEPDNGIGKPGNSIENNDASKETAEDAPHTDARACCKQNLHPHSATGGNHQFVRAAKGVGYVFPLPRKQDNKVIDNLCEPLQEVNGILDGDNYEEMQNDGSSKDMNGNPPCSSPDISQEVTTDTRFLAPQLPPPLKSFGSCPELPPRIPPKPASLRNRPLHSPDPLTSSSGITDELDDSDIPPRPPARPKNRTLGKGSIMLLNSQRDNPHDKRATVYETISLEPKQVSLAKELAKLPRQPWYWGPLTQAQAEEKLAKLPDGNFLVRDSSDERYLLSLSFNSHGRTLHTRIEHRNGLFSLNDSDGHTSVVELIACAVKESRSGVYGYMRDALGVQSFPARLTDWVSRFTEMRSLQHLCRFLIREVYPRHHIQMLPLPKKIKEYILENQY